jgi:hypothetical protein
VIDEHGRLGLYVVLVAWPFALLALLAAVLGRRPPGSAARVAGVLAAVAGVAAVVTTVLAGHSGSSAVWGAVLR